MSNLDKLLNGRPKLLKGQQSLIQTHPSSEFSLNLERALFTVQPTSKLIQPIQIQFASKQYQEQIEEIDINEEKFEAIIPKKQLRDPIINKPVQEDIDTIPIYVKEEEKTKQFIVETLGQELARLDINTENLLNMIESEQNKMNKLVNENEKISEEVKQMVKDKKLEDKISFLEDQLNVPKELKLNLINSEWNIVNERIEQMFRDNKELYEEADAIQEQFTKQQLEFE